MARSVKEIQDEIIEQKNEQPELVGLDSTSKVSVWRMWTYITAVAIWSLEKLFDLHSNEVTEKLAHLKPHTARWYRSKALLFQYGFDLLSDSDNYDNTGADESEVENSKVIKYCAVVESESVSRLIIKIATEDSDELSPVGGDILESFQEYIAEIKDAGVAITVINYLPDRLKLTIRIIRNALLLDAEGRSIRNGNKPVEDAIKSYLKLLPFNGNFSIQKLIDNIQQVEGVEDVSIDEALTCWIDGTLQDYGNWESIDIHKVPESGYYTVSYTDNEYKSMISYE